MVKRYVLRTFFGFAALAAAAALTEMAVSAKQPPPPAPFSIHAEFDSVLLPQGAPDCPVVDENGAPTGLLLVQGIGIGAGTRISNHAAGTAQECSLPVGLEFHVTGKGTYTAPDGSVLYLHYHEISENPFTTPPGLPPDPQWTLHDHGTWTIDPDLSTGRFHGATGSGTITAEVPIYLDFNTGQFLAHVFADYVGTIVFAQGQD
jgi:hypothetical protein